MQNLVSRIAGINNEELANRGIGMGAAMGHTVRSIAYQFKSNSENGERPDFISRVMQKSNESNVTSSINCESNSKNAMSESNSRPITSNAVKTEDKNINKDISKNNSNSGGLKRAYNVGKEFMNMGMYMAEGRNFKTNRQYNRHNINNSRREDFRKKYNEDSTITNIQEQDKT